MSPSERGDLVFLLNILESSGRILNYIKNINSAEEFKSIEMQLEYDASMLQLINIGENVSRLTEKLRQEHDFIKWQYIKDLRNKIAHDYFGIKVDVVYNIAKNDVIVLKARVENIIKTNIKTNIFEEVVLQKCKDSKHYRYINFDKLLNE